MQLSARSTKEPNIHQNEMQKYVQWQTILNSQLKTKRKKIECREEKKWEEGSNLFWLYNDWFGR
jgi:hypothetical protein